MSMNFVLLMYFKIYDQDKWHVTAFLSKEIASLVFIFWYIIIKVAKHVICLIGITDFTNQ